MTAPRRLARSVALATTGLALTAAVLAPTASATGYTPKTPPPSTQVLGVKYGPNTSSVLPATQVLSVASSSDQSSLAYTGAAVGGTVVGGLVLVGAGALLVRGGRRRRSDAV